MHRTIGLPAISEYQSFGLRTNGLGLGGRCSPLVRCIIKRYPSVSRAGTMIFTSVCMNVYS